MSDEEINNRFKDWKPYEREIKSEFLLKFKALVTSAAKGAIFEFGGII